MQGNGKIYDNTQQTYYQLLAQSNESENRSRWIATCIGGTINDSVKD